MSAVTDSTDQALTSERVEFATTIADQAQRIADLERQLADLTTKAQPLIGCCQPEKVWGHQPQAVRWFIPGGKQPTSLDLSDVPQKAMLIISRKDRGSWFSSLLSSIRLNRPDLDVVPVLGIHEPEDDVKRGELTVAGYKTWCNEDADAFDGVQILMGSTGNQGTWAQWLVDKSAGLWFDVYMPAAGVVPKQYKDPAAWLKTYLDIQAQVGKPMGFPEFAFRPMATTAAGEAEYLKQIRRYRDYVLTLDPKKVRTACWYNSPGAPAEFTTQARADAWLL